MTETADGHARDYAAIALRYARNAWKDKRLVYDRASGRKVPRGDRHCHWVRLAAKRHLDDLKRSRRRNDWDYYFDEWHANDVCDFIEKLPHVEGEWDTPTIRLEDWQIFILVVVFGWRRHADGHRRLNTAYIELARKNGKSALSSGVALYCLTCEGEVGPQIKCGATTGDQARIVFNVAKKMVERTPDLREAFDVHALANSIACYESGGAIQPINAKASTQDGLNPHLAIMDELHAHKDRGLFDVLKSARGARKNPLSWYITTAGYNLKGVCYEQRKLVAKILEGAIEADHYFGIIFTIDDESEEFDESKWVKANPNLDVSVQLHEMRGYAAEARTSPDSHYEFATKRTNRWVGAINGWISVPRWKLCDGLVDLDELRDVPCGAGLDLASTEDMNSLALTWELDGRLKVWVRHYLPEETVNPRTERANVPYLTWQKADLLVITPGEVTDYAYIERDLDELLGRFNIIGVGYDKWNALDLVNRMMAKSAPMVEFRQGPQSFNDPMKQFERHIIARTLDHGGDPVLTWQASNIVARKDVNENMAPDKRNSEEKIDGIVAALMGYGMLLTAEEQKTPSVMWA